MKEKAGFLFSIKGVKGGVGSSFVSSLFSRLMSKKGPYTTALIDGIPSEYSLVPSFLNISPPFRDFAQLNPYIGQITDKLLRGFFSKSKDGTAYIPFSASGDNFLSPEQVLNSIKAIQAYFDIVFIDLSSFSSETTMGIARETDALFLISAPDASCLSAIRSSEKIFSSKSIPAGKVSFILNLSNRSFVLPTHPQDWSKKFPYSGHIPFLGDDAPLLLNEIEESDPRIEALFTDLIEPVLNRTFSAGGRLNIQPRNSNEAFTPHQLPSLEEIHTFHQKLLDHLRRSGIITEASTGDAERKALLTDKVRRIMEEMLDALEDHGLQYREALISKTMDLVFGLGPLEDLLKDPDISEIMVNGASDIFVERYGMLEKENRAFFNEGQLRTIIERILAPIGRRIDENQPFVDGRLPDGSRVNAVVAPISLNGPILTIRKFSKNKINEEALLKTGSFSKECIDFLSACIKARKNILISGGTGSGKTTLLNLLSNYIPPNERIITIEDSAELSLLQTHVVKLESRPSNIEGNGRISIRDLVINALRMRPDRIIVGEVRSGEALDMLQAMNTGHDGSLTTIHANSPRDALARLETLCLFSGLELPVRAIREQVARAIHLVIQQNRLPGGKRGIVKVSEIQGMEGDVIVMQDLFQRIEPAEPLSKGNFQPKFISELAGVGYKWEN